jgi:hypothetical protein
MRILLMLVLLVVVLVTTPGCGGGRPDPRANPDFDEAAYQDPSLSGQKLSEDTAVKR